MKVVAEGVETVEQFLRLRQMHCPAGQGFWFSTPLHQDAVIDYLRETQAQAQTPRRLPAAG
jgi:EAL domain-containing protein (putative c-di-GMP-specific phosphodiesterase class I)